MPAWEQKQTPWWERQAPPPWEQKKVPLPQWAQTYNGRALLDRGKNQRSRRPYQPSMVYVLPPYRYFSNSLATTTQFYVTPPPPTAVTTESAAPMGALQLDVEPRDLLQVFVDGSYVGTPRDLDNLVEMTPGTHRIELRAPGYRTLIFDADIVADKAITYRGALERDAPMPVTPSPAVVAPPPAPTGSKTIYVIPGCYLGNVAPKASELRAGCDISRLSTISPH